MIVNSLLNNLKGSIVISFPFGGTPKKRIFPAGRAYGYTLLKHRDHSGSINDNIIMLLFYLAEIREDLSNSLCSSKISSTFIFFYYIQLSRSYVLKSS